LVENFSLSFLDTLSSALFSESELSIELSSESDVTLFTVFSSGLEYDSHSDSDSDSDSDGDGDDDSDGDGDDDSDDSDDDDYYKMILNSFKYDSKMKLR
jgi:hypothetical protein